MGDDVTQVISGDKWRKIRTLLLSPTSDMVELGLFVLESLVPPAVDLESFLGASAVRTLGRLADGWLLDANDVVDEWLCDVEFTSLLQSEESVWRKGTFAYADGIMSIPPLDTLAHAAGKSSNVDSAEAIAAFVHYHRVVVRPMFLARAARDAGSLSPVIDLVRIPEGEFTMGTEEYSSCRPVRRVHITKPFQIGRTAVTQGQWKQVMGTAPWLNKHALYRDSGEGHIVREQDDVAATCVSWQEAMLFCRVLTELEHQRGRLDPGFVYRLPTEAEWEYACRAGTTSKWSFGDDAERLGEHAWYWDDYPNRSPDGAHPVGRKKPNPWGLFDMHGNVWEWCNDRYRPDYAPHVHPLNPDFRSLNSDFRWDQLPRALRGGHWASPEAKTISASRTCTEPAELYLGEPLNHRSIGCGFRVVCAAP